MISEAEYAESKMDFIHELAIAQKETSESLYWLELMERTKYLPAEKFEEVNKTTTEVMEVVNKHHQEN